MARARAPAAALPLLLLAAAVVLLGSRCARPAGGEREEDGEAGDAAPLELRPFAVGLRAPRGVSRVNLATEAALVVWEHAARRRGAHGVLWEFASSFEASAGAEDGGAY